MFGPERKLRTLILCALITAAALATLTGCEDDDDDYDHNPPAGMGTLILENDTYDDVTVALDGRIQPEVREDSDRKYDLEPGIWRLVLDQQGGDQNWRGDVDIIEGHLTIVNIGASADPDDFFISVRFD
ncbi:MAG: hypothetical protein AB7T27_11690 [Kiritimatiellia bacterium]